MSTLRERLTAGYGITESGCWEWKRSTNSRGYGLISERVVVGQREVTREVPTATTTVTETEDVYEWRCVPLLAKAEAQP